MIKIKKINVDQLRLMRKEEGLILQGCGGELTKWVSGINELLTKEGILENGSSFDRVMVFENGPLTNLLFLFDEVELNIDKLSIWRIKTAHEFAGMWLTDYIENKLESSISSKNEEMTLC